MKRSLLHRFMSAFCSSISRFPLCKLTEEIYPQLADSLMLGKSWDYSELYDAILEYSSKTCRISKYKIYSEQEFILLLKDKLPHRLRQEDKPDIIMQLAY